jgi:CRISPR-associated protein Csd2
MTKATETLTIEATGTKHADPNKKHDFILLYDVIDGNPNGDPDADNLPRTDAETQQGIVSDVCLKRKVRNYVSLVSDTLENPEHFKIYVEEGAVLNENHERAYTALKLPKDSKERETITQARNWMCENFYDVRMFGAVMSTGEHNAGQVRGPVQIMFSRSQDPVFPQSLAITRMAVTNVKDKDKQRTIGRKALVPYGLYRTYGFYNPAFGKQTGVTQTDLKLFWQSLIQMWEFDRSAARGFISPRTLIVFTHDSPWGNAPAHKLFERLHISKHPEVVARDFSDYQISLDNQELPDGVTVTSLI